MTSFDCCKRVCMILNLFTFIALNLKKENYEFIQREIRIITADTR